MKKDIIIEEVIDEMDSSEPEDQGNHFVVEMNEMPNFDTCITVADASQAVGDDHLMNMPVLKPPYPNKVSKQTSINKFLGQGSLNKLGRN